MKVLELRGIPSYFATQAFHKLMLGLKMLPAYMGQTYEEFYAVLDQLEPSQQEGMIREAALFVKLDQEELLDLVQFCSDANGIPYGKNNIKTLPPEEIHEIVVAVCTEIAKDHSVKLLSAAEKKN